MTAKYCPLCHSKLIFYFSEPIFASNNNENNNEVIDHYNIYFCPNHNCNVKKVIYDDDNNLLNTYYYKNIQTKYKKLLFSIKSRLRFYKPKTRKKMRKKKEELEKLLNS